MEFFAEIDKLMVKSVRKCVAEFPRQLRIRIKQEVDIRIMRLNEKSKSKPLNLCQFLTKVETHFKGGKKSLLTNGAMELGI